MRILILNWRDIKNPEHGGAEILTHEMAKRWVRWGHSVTQFSSRFSGSKEKDTVDGVTIVRFGSSQITSMHLPVHLAAFFWYQRHWREFDVVIDEIHGIPFFSVLYVKRPVVALICEVAGDLWDIAFSWPTNSIGTIIENYYFRLYRTVLFLTISQSSKAELIKKGVGSHQITVLPMGVTIPPSARQKRKEQNPTLIYVGRLTKAKGIEDAMDIVGRLKNSLPNVKLWVVGSGDSDYVSTLTKRIKSQGLWPNVQLFGYISEQKKFDLMARAHILIAPSYKEGWGLTPIEAGSVGTPSVAYNVDGLRDCVLDNKTGLLTMPAVSSMDQGIRKLLGDKILYKKLQDGAVKRAK
ncbi:glycosyltransferase family 4 protein, partial [Candidatus Roizmanbacteria bacterium]|nr:glycosyltransferase family 4 protein [Candidatus Roizmanbacteria bacterium]